MQLETRNCQLSEEMLSSALLQRWRNYHTASFGRATREVTSLLWPGKPTAPYHHVVLVGAFNAGKSTLVSTLLQENVAYTYSLPTTWHVTEFHHSPLLSIEMHDPEGRIEKKIFSSRDDLFRRWFNGADVLNSLPSPESRMRIKAIGLPHPLLRSGITLIDTPGHDSLRLEDSELAIDATTGHASILYLCLAQQVLRETDLAVLKKIGMTGRRWALVLTRGGRKASLPQWLESMEKHALSILEGEGIPCPSDVLLAPEPLGDAWCRNPIENQTRRLRILNTLVAWQQSRPDTNNSQTGV